MSKYSAKYHYIPDKMQIDDNINLIADNLDKITTPEVLKACFSFMDLTSLSAADTPASIGRWVEKLNAFQTVYPDCPLPASVCVYPNLVPAVRAHRRADVRITAVAGCFPASQSYLEVKLHECRLAVENGADEIDIVLSLNAFLSDDYERAGAEIAAVRQCVDAAADRPVILKVILETGLLVTPERIADAAFLAMESGADFIKTSTGKVEVNATPVAAYIMCECIRRFREETGRKVGFKAAGGISAASDAVCYYSIVSSVLGQEWLTKDLFRFGVSRLANGLLSVLEQKTVSYF